jgi:dynein heavy chain
VEGAAKAATFILAEHHLKDESFLDLLTSFLNTGEVSLEGASGGAGSGGGGGGAVGLFPKEEWAAMAAEVRPRAITERHDDFSDNPVFLRRFLVDSARDHLHLVFCLNPSHPRFSERLLRRFPSLLGASVSVDWFLAWPLEALVTVGRHHLLGADAASAAAGTDGGSSSSSSSSGSGSTGGSVMGGSMTGGGALGMGRLLSQQQQQQLLRPPPDVAESLALHFAAAHRTMVGCCEDSWLRRKRKVHPSPRTYLGLLEGFTKLFHTKAVELEDKAKSVMVGLRKLEQGAEDVEKLKVALAGEDVKLRGSDDKAIKLLGQLEKASMASEKEAEVVGVIKAKAEADRAEINEEKGKCNSELAKARPFAEEAERAAQAVNVAEMNDLRKVSKPTDIVKLVFDCVGIILNEPLAKPELTEITLGIGREKRTLPFFSDSFKLLQAGVLSESRFLQNLVYFCKSRKDDMSDETMEFLMPYLDLENFTPIGARSASKAAESLCVWVKSLHAYHEASRHVKPKLEALRLAEAKLHDTQTEQDKAQAKLDVCTDVLSKLKEDFEAEMEGKRLIAEGAAKTRQRMTKAEALMEGLVEEREQWTSLSRQVSQKKAQLAGDAASACTFLAYAGPFGGDSDVRSKVLLGKGSTVGLDLAKRGVQTSPGFTPASFLVDEGVVGEWAMQGLPTTDAVSVENGE